MKQNLRHLVFFLSFFVGAVVSGSVASAKVGDSCTANGYTGTCQLMEDMCPRSTSGTGICDGNSVEQCCYSETPAAGAVTLSGDCKTVGQSCSGGTCAQNQETGEIYCKPSSAGNSIASTSSATSTCSSVGQACTGGVCAQNPEDGALYCKFSTSGGGGSTTTSPVPSVSGGSGSVTSGGGSSTASNRTSASVTGGTSRGLYIPRGSEVGLSEMSVTSLIRNLLNWLLYIVGFVAIIAFVISGMQYLMAGADEEMAKKGKANMTYAIIGVLVALSALIIIRAIQSVLSGSWMF